MSWTNVKLIFLREVRDQLRDRRTLFMIAVLPILLYPLMGSIFLRILAFRQDHASRVWIVGASNLPKEPRLLEGKGFSPGLLVDDTARTLEVIVEQGLPPEFVGQQPLPAATEVINAGRYDAIIYIPPKFAEELEAYRRRLLDPSEPSDASVQIVAGPQIFANTAHDKSRIAYDRAERIMQRWRGAVVAKNLADQNVPAAAVKPFEVANTDVAEDTVKRAMIWSKLLPFVLVIWALTGAFYPAIDLCAGEKERGTLETLLSSPAQRKEIVWGKLLTVMSFSITTSILNMLSMAITGGFVFSRMQAASMSSMELELGPPPLLPMLWLLVAIVPISALFSALSLAIAAFARSSKEGQYYLMPLLILTLPLMIIPMMPAVELTMGTALIPVTGVMFLLRSLIEGQFLEAARYALPVIGVTAVGCLLAVRWAVDQFNNESVLFRESERWDLRLWLRHVVRDCGETPTVGEAILCGVLILIAGFFASLAVTQIPSARAFVVIHLVTQFALIAFPALLMTIMLTSNPRRTLSLYLPRPQMLPLAVLLAVLLNPAVNWLAMGIQALYPMSSEMNEVSKQALEPLMEQPVWVLVLLIAIVPAICEEIAFRGFMLSGLRHTGHVWGAIAISSVFFGITHSLLQQSMSAMCVGLLIGYLTLRTGSLLTGILFHMTHNALMIVIPTYLPEVAERFPAIHLLVRESPHALLYHPIFAAACGLCAVALLYWLSRQPYHRFAEERLQQALDHQPNLAAPSKALWRLW